MIKEIIVMKNDEIKSGVTPILIREDNLEYRTDLHKLEYWVLKNHASKIEKAFESLDMGLLTDEYLQDILLGNLSKTKEVLTDQIQKEVTSRFLQGDANVKVQTLISKLSDAYEALNETVQRVGIWSLLEYLSVNERGKIRISEESKSELLETHRVYVSTPDGINRYKLHLKAVKAMNEFKKAMSGHLGNADIFDCFDIGEDENVMVVPLEYE